MPTATSLQPVQQNRFLRGLNTVAGIYTQPKGCVPRMKNLLLSKRGSLIVAQQAATFQTPTMAFLQFFVDLYQQAVTPFQANTGAAGVTVTVNEREFALLQTNHHLVAPIPTLLGVNVGTGVLIPGNTYTYTVTALDNINGETLASIQVNLVLPGGMNAVQVTIPAPNEGVAFNVYGRTALSQQALTSVFNVPLAQWQKVPIFTNTFTDDGINVPIGVPAPSVDLTTSLELYDMKVNQPAGGGGLTPAKLASFTPCTLNPFNTAQALRGLTINGGGSAVYPSDKLWVGNTSPLSQMMQFGKKVIVALGNNHPVKILDPETLAVADITNNFSATIPDWAAARTVAVDDLVLPTVNNAGAFIYKVVQGGVTGAAVPGAFPQVQGQQVADGNVMWENTGTVNTNPAPRAAAHALAYAGSLALLNTAPVTTSDGLDGPNVIAFSDFNNVNSWNPRNRVFVAKDDGQQIMGGAYFAVADTGIIPTGGLVVFRDFSTFIVLGFPPNEQVVQVQTDKGCIAPRTIKFVPGLGIVRLTHLGWAAYNGVEDKLIDDAISNVTQPTGAPEDVGLTLVDDTFSWFSKAALLNNPTAYACAVPTVAGTAFTLTDAYCLDIPSKSWFRISFTNDWGSGTCHTFQNSGVTNDALAPPAIYIGDSTGRQILQWMFASTPSTALGGMTPEVYVAGHVRTYFRRLTVRGFARAGGATTLSVLSGYGWG
jgi:hypothetical protein